MRPFHRFALALALPCSVDLVANGVFATITGEVGYFLWTLGYDAATLIVLNLFLARIILFRPVAALLAGDTSPARLAALNSLPTRSALWIVAVYLTLFPLGMFLSPIAGSYGGDFDLPLDYVYFIAGIFAALAGYLVFYLTNGFVTHLKLDLFHTRGLIVPATGARIRPRLVAALALISAMPLVVISAEFFYFERYRGKGLDLPFEDAIIVDIIVSAVMVVVTLIFLPSTLTRPIEILRQVVERVAGGDLRARAPVTSNDEIGGLTLRFNEMVEGLEERQAIRETFGKYVPEAVAERLLRDPTMLEGDTRVATILFTDIAGFTGISETLSPTDTIAMLNAYFEVILEPIRAEGGTVNAFIGDSVFASFNVPVPHDDHAGAAIRAALAIDAALQARRFGPDGDVVLNTRIGINTGPVAAGAVGTGDRLGYTIIGDTVNVASRLEGLVKELGGPVLVSETTRQAVAANAAGAFRFEQLGAVTIRGRTETIPVWRVSAA